MTSEQFQRDYQLLDRVTEGAVETYHAQATSGAMVMVHYLRASEEGNTEIYGLIERLDADRKRKVLISTDVDGVPAIITRFILDFRTLREWLGAPSAAASSENATPAKAPPPRSAAGEFTMMFGSPVDADKADPPAVQAPAPPPPEPLAPPPPKSEPGEFTRMFASGSDAPAPVSPPPAAVPPPPKKSQANSHDCSVSQPRSSRPQQHLRRRPKNRASLPAIWRPGAARRNAASNVVPRGPVRPTTSTAGARRVHRNVWCVIAPVRRTTACTRAAVNATERSAPADFSAPPVDELSFGAPPAPNTPAGGSYTRMFGVPAPPQDPHEQLFPNQPAPSADAGAGHDQYFERLTKGLSPSLAPPPSPSAPPPPMYTGQSEFTRVVSALPTPPLASPPPPTIAPAPAPARSNRILLFGLVGVVLTAIIFVVLLIAIG
jgi:hypothetical protein